MKQTKRPIVPTAPEGHFCQSSAQSTVLRRLVGELFKERERFIDCLFPPSEVCGLTLGLLIVRVVLQDFAALTPGCCMNADKIKAVIQIERYALVHAQG